MNKQTATSLLHTHLYQQGILINARVESCSLGEPFKFNAIQFLLSQGLTQQPIRKQCYKLLSLVVHVAGRTLDPRNSDALTQKSVYAAVKNVVAMLALDLTDPEHSKVLVPQLIAHLTNWGTDDPRDELHKRLGEALELVTQALCCVNADNWDNR